MANTWNCPHCGAVVERTDDRCAKCGANVEGNVDEDSLETTLAQATPSRTTAISETQNQDSSARGASGAFLQMLVRTVPFIRHRPWLIAFVGTVLACGAALFIAVETSIGHGNTIASSVLGIALFTPGAIQTGRWRPVAIMAIIGGVSPFVMDWLLTYLADSHDWTIAWRLIWSVGVTCLLVTSQWLITPNDSLRRLGWGMLVVVSTTAIYRIVAFTALNCRWLDRSWSGLVDVCLFAVVVWVVLPFAFRIAESSGRRTKILVAASSLAGLFACLLFFRTGVYSLGKTSMFDLGPFSRRYGVQLLDHRGQQRDYESVLAALAQADWNEPWDQYNFEPDWRSTAVQLLVHHDRKWAAERLAAILCERPSRTLIDMTDGLFVEEKRYETAPIYLRYALLTSKNFSYFAFVGADKYRIALEKMGVPQVVDAWLYQEVILQDVAARLREQNGGPVYVPLAAEEVTIRDELRPRLAALLGEDAGPFYLDWETLYEERIDEVTTPLSPEQHAEANRVVKCFADYWLAWNDCPRDAEPPEPNWNATTIGQLEAEVDRYERQAKSAWSARSR